MRITKLSAHQTDTIWRATSIYAKLQVPSEYTPITKFIRTSNEIAWLGNQWVRGKLGIWKKEKEEEQEMNFLRNQET